MRKISVTIQSDEEMERRGGRKNEKMKKGRGNKKITTRKECIAETRSKKGRHEGNNTSSRTYAEETNKEEMGG